MAKKKTAAAAAPVGGDIITTLDPNDVLFGRGSGASLYCGNQRFRDLIDERKEEYNAHSQFNPKRKIAKEILDRIHSAGGRFLRLDESKEPVDFVVEEGAWRECEEKSALEKIKQGLRQKKRSPDEGKKQTPVTHSETPSAEGNVTRLDSSISMLRPLCPVPSPTSSAVPSSLTMASAAVLAGSSMAPSAIDPRLLLLLQPSLFAPGAPFGDRSTPNLGLALSPPDAYISGRALPNHLISNPCLAGEPSAPMMVQQQRKVEDTSSSSSLAATAAQKRSLIDEEGTQNTPSSLEEAAASDPEAMDNEIPEYLFSVLGLAGQETLSEQQVALEKATLTDTERAGALSDLFGHMCLDDTQESKKPRRDLDDESIAFLVKQMRIEIEAIPVDKKPALIEASAKARPEEFCDERLEMFLRCEGMNTKLAAQRFVCYWEARRDLFGEEKFTLRMTLSEALRDDLLALEAGVYCQLPNLDSSGRSVIYWDPSRHTREGYTPESLVRAVWYVTEVVAQASTDVSKGIVQVVPGFKTTIWDFDAKAYPRIAYLEDNAFPVRVAAHHYCGSSSSAVFRFVKPVIMALKNRASRHRTQSHDVPENEIVHALSNYGLLDSMLPTEIGGSVPFNQSDWIAKRRAAEMEEIS